MITRKQGWKTVKMKVHLDSMVSQIDVIDVIDQFDIIFFAEESYHSIPYLSLWPN